MSRENVETVRRIYEAWNRLAAQPPDEAFGSDAFDFVDEFFSPDVELRQLGDIPGTGGTFRGHAGLLEAGRELLEGLDDIRFIPRRCSDAGDRVGFHVTASAKGRASGAPVERQLGHLWELREGQVVRWVVYPTPDEAFEALGLRE